MGRKRTSKQPSLRGNTVQHSANNRPGPHRPSPASPVPQPGLKKSGKGECKTGKQPPASKVNHDSQYHPKTEPGPDARHPVLHAIQNNQTSATGGPDLGRQPLAPRTRQKNKKPAKKPSGPGNPPFAGGPDLKIEENLDAMTPPIRPFNLYPAAYRSPKYPNPDGIAKTQAQGNRVPH
jgi:hypothetical protein